MGIHEYSCNATWLFGLFKISCLFIAPFENEMGFFTLKTQIEFSPRVPPEPLRVPLGVRVPQFGKRCSIQTHTHTCSLSLSLSLSYTHIHTLMLSLSLSLSYTHTHIHTLM